MELVCLNCNTNYELSNSQICPKCGSDRSLNKNNLDPYYSTKLRKIARYIVILLSLASAFGIALLR
jgi:predicted amidophosphoribosyltransferase